MSKSSMALCEAVCHSANLAAAFRRYKNHRGLWLADTPMSLVSSQPIEEVLALAEELRSGCYRPQAPHTVSIAKANGDRRELRIYAIRDRVAQRAVLQVLQRHTEPAMAASSFGYRPGRSVDDAGRRVCRYLSRGLPWVVDADIERCFDSIPRHELLAEVVRRMGDCSAAELVAQCLGWDSPDECNRIGLPLGAVLAPWLCNVYLWHLDEQMRGRGTAMVRFADDFVLFEATRKSAEATRRFCETIVQALGLRLHPLKTSIIDAREPFRFLGQWFAAPAERAPGTADAYAALH